MIDVGHFHAKRAMAYRLSWEKEFEDQFLEVGGSLMVLAMREQAIASEQPWESYPEQVREEAQTKLMQFSDHQMLMDLQLSTESTKAQDVEDFLDFWKTVTARKWLAWFNILRMFNHIDQETWLLALSIYQRHDKMAVVGDRVEVLVKRMTSK